MTEEQASIRAASHKVAAYIDNYLTRTNADRREEILEMFDHLHTVFPQWVISICHMLHPDIHYISGNAPHIYGYSREYMLASSSMEKYFSHVHEADRKKLYECAYFMHEYLESLPLDQQHKHRTVLHYRFRKADGQYICLHDERAIIQLRDAGNLYYSLIRDVTLEKVFTGVKAELFRQDGGLVKIKEYRPLAADNTLSKREEELVSLMRQGLTSKEIAQRLQISPNTVRNVKSRLFERFNVNNSIELLNKTL